MGTNQIIFKSSKKNIYIAKRYFYKNTLSITSLILLPILSLPFGGILPRYIILFYNYIYDIMMIFDYCIIGICIIFLLFLFMMFFIIFSFFNGGNKKNVGVGVVGKKKKKKSVKKD